MRKKKKEKELVRSPHAMLDIIRERIGCLLQDIQSIASFHLAALPHMFIFKSFLSAR